MTGSIVFDNTNSDLQSATPLVFANNNPYDNSSISLCTTQPDSIYQNQTIEYNCNQPFQDLLEEAKNVYNNHIMDSTHLQYHSAKAPLFIDLFKNYRHIILQPYTDEYK